MCGSCLYFISLQLTHIGGGKSQLGGSVRTRNNFRNGSVAGKTNVSVWKAGPAQLTPRERKYHQNRLALRPHSPLCQFLLTSEV